MSRKVVIPDKVGPDTMLRLEAAGAIAFPDGSMPGPSLRREARAGRLTTYRIAGKDYTTLADIQEMQTKCRVPARAPDFSSKKPMIGSGSGSSATGSGVSAQAALKATVQKLRENLQRTSSASTTPKPAATAVIPIRSK